MGRLIPAGTGVTRYNRMEVGRRTSRRSAGGAPEAATRVKRGEAGRVIATSDDHLTR